jgi:twitching motility protein PilT
MISKTVERWLDEMWAVGASDLHLAVGAPPQIRVDGGLRAVSGSATPLTSAEVAKHATALLDRDATTLDVEGSVDFGLTWGARARLRGNLFKERGNLGMALRMIPQEVPSLEYLGVPPAVNRLLDLPSGIVIVTGPTGSGKSTTLASLLDTINQQRSCHIITIEDPIEYLHEHRSSIVQQREIGTDATSFPDALRSALREDPDVLLLGEMRDLESIQTALTIAETGHLVLATLHTNDSSQAIDRIIDVFPADRRAQIQVQLASTLQAVVYQRLLPRVDGGRVAAFEVLMATHAVRNLVREGKSRQLRNVVATSTADGMQTLEQHLTELVAAGVVTHDAALGASLYPAEVKEARSGPGGPRLVAAREPQPV